MTLTAGVAVGGRILIAGLTWRVRATAGPRLKGGPEPSNFEDLCLVNVSVKYFSKPCFGTIKIQPELKYLKPILEDFTY